MDGNGRWATKRALKRSEGHLAGSKTLKNLGLYAFKRGIKVLSVYAFSTDNFKRDKEEVNYLMDLIIYNFLNEYKIFEENNIKVVISGRKEPLRKDVIEAMNNIIERTKNNTGGILNICLNYGSEEEIVDASIEIAKKYKNGKLKLEDINKENFMKYMYNDLPPIDLLIRTSGEFRLSNFMLYQSSYAEFYFTRVLFPDFNGRELDKAIINYNKRDRRFGGIKKK
jgi:undecaprenyl diphosphate synthase